MQKYYCKTDRIREFKLLMSSGYQPVQCDHLARLLDGMGFFDAPASTKYHGNYTGGLYEHSEDVTRNLVWLTEKLGLPGSIRAAPIWSECCTISASATSTPGSRTARFFSGTTGL